MRKRWLAITILIAFAAIAVFGFLGMAHGADHGGGCLAVTAGVLSCTATGPVTEAIAHVAAWEGFSMAVLVMSVLVSAFIIVIVGRIRDQADWNALAVLLLPVRRRCFAFRNASIPPRVLRWLALRERRDPAPMA